LIKKVSNFRIFSNGVNCTVDLRLDDKHLCRMGTVKLKFTLW